MSAFNTFALLDSDDDEPVKKVTTTKKTSVSKNTSAKTPVAPAGDRNDVSAKGRGARRDGGGRGRGAGRGKGDRRGKGERRPRDGKGEKGERRQRNERRTHSGKGDGIGREAPKRGGAGRGNWGAIGDEAKETVEGETVEEVVVDVVEEPVEPEEPEEPSFSVSEHYARMAAEKQASELLRVVEGRKVDDAELLKFKKAGKKVAVQEDFYVGGSKKLTRKGQKKAAPSIFKDTQFQRPREDDDRRRDRGTRAPRSVKQVVNTDSIEAFPSLA